MEATRAADGGAGVLLLYGNYGGDRMNFDMADEMLADEGVRCVTMFAAGSSTRRSRNEAIMAFAIGVPLSIVAAVSIAATRAVRRSWAVAFLAPR